MIYCSVYFNMGKKMVRSKRDVVDDENSDSGDDEKIMEHPKRNFVEKVNLAPKKKKSDSEEDECILTGEPVPVQEAKQRWPHRYLCKVFFFFLD